MQFMWVVACMPQTSPHTES